MNRKRSTIKDQLEELNLSIAMLQEKINIVSDRLNEENEKMYNRGKKKEQFKEVKSKTIKVSRATLYNVINLESHTVSKSTAMLISTAINETRKLRNLPEVELDLNIYNSWERRK